jgi:hypothetical protein
MMMNNNNSFNALKLNIGILAFAIVTLVGCAKKDTAVSSNNSAYELQRKRSLELENPIPAGALKTEDLTIESNAEAAPVGASDKIVTKTAPIGRDYTSKEVKESKKMQAKVDKVRKMVEKRSIKLKEKITARGGGLNQNLKIGLILILVGILIAVLLGSLINGYVFGAIGTIVAVIGIVFLILGLLEM